MEKEAKPSYNGNLWVENRNGLILDATVLEETGRTERDAALATMEKIPGQQRVTVPGDKGYDSRDFVAECRNRGFLFLVWPWVITPSVPSTVGFFVFGDLGFVLQGHSNLVQTEQQTGARERINRKPGGKTVRGRNCAALQIDGQLESTGLGTRHKLTNLCRRESLAADHSWPNLW